MIQCAEFSLTTTGVQEVDLSSYRGGKLTIYAFGDPLYVVLNCADSTVAATALSATTGTIGRSNRMLIPASSSYTFEPLDIALLHFKRSGSTTVNVFLVLDNCSTVV